MTGYYDAILGLIPLALGGVSTTLYLSGIEKQVAILVASLIAVGLVGHAMFVRAPVTERVERTPQQSAPDRSGFRGAD